MACPAPAFWADDDQDSQASLDDAGSEEGALPWRVAQEADSHYPSPSRDWRTSKPEVYLWEIIYKT